MRGQKVITGPMVLAGALAFFAVVLAANGALVFFALNSFPGLVTDKPYETGLAYNRVLEDARRQAARGWTSEIRLDGVRGRDQGRDQGHVQVRITGPDKAPIEGLVVEVTFRRPLGAAQERRVSLREVSPGLYGVEASLPLAGRWLGTIEAARGGEPLFRMEHELMVKR